MWTPLGTVPTPTLTGTHDWTRVTAEGTAPRDVFFVRVHLNADHDTGTVWFDDISPVEE